MLVLDIVACSRSNRDRRCDVEEEKINSFSHGHILVFTTETPSGFCFIVKFIAAKEVKNGDDGKVGAAVIRVSPFAGKKFSRGYDLIGCSI
jgi:hypothetical protein